jgi:hypothetical protein
MRVFVLEDWTSHLLAHRFSADGAVVGHEEDLLADALEPLYVSERVSHLQLVSVPEHAIAVEQKVVKVICHHSDRSPVKLGCCCCHLYFSLF